MIFYYDAMCIILNKIIYFGIDTDRLPKPVPF